MFIWQFNHLANIFFFFIFRLSPKYPPVFQPPLAAVSNKKTFSRASKAATTRVRFFFGASVQLKKREILNSAYKSTTVAARKREKQFLKAFLLVAQKTRFFFFFALLIDYRNIFMTDAPIYFLFLFFFFLFYIRRQKSRKNIQKKKATKWIEREKWFHSLTFIMWPRKKGDDCTSKIMTHQRRRAEWKIPRNGEFNMNLR